MAEQTPVFYENWFKPKSDSTLLNLSLFVIIAHLVKVFVFGETKGAIVIIDNNWSGLFVVMMALSLGNQAWVRFNTLDKNSQIKLLTLIVLSMFVLGMSLIGIFFS